jgi:hypothetical protein
MLKPNAIIRRFDVFAEYQRQQAIKQGMPAAQAKGYGLWLAKVVAARRYGSKTKSPSDTATERKLSHRKWRTLGDEPQTDKLFDQQIINRMGTEFYRRVFVPAIRKAIAEHEDYTEIRDAIREHWTP